MKLVYISKNCIVSKNPKQGSVLVMAFLFTMTLLILIGSMITSSLLPIQQETLQLQHECSIAEAKRMLSVAAYACVQELENPSITPSSAISYQTFFADAPSDYLSSITLPINHYTSNISQPNSWPSGASLKIGSFTPATFVWKSNSYDGRDPDKGKAYWTRQVSLFAQVPPVIKSSFDYRNGAYASSTANQLESFYMKLLPASSGTPVYMGCVLEVREIPVTNFRRFSNYSFQINNSSLELGVDLNAKDTGGLLGSALHSNYNVYLNNNGSPMYIHNRITSAGGIVSANPNYLNAGYIGAPGGTSYPKYPWTSFVLSPTNMDFFDISSGTDLTGLQQLAEDLRINYSGNYLPYVPFLKVRYTTLPGDLKSSDFNTNLVEGSNSDGSNNPAWSLLAPPLPAGNQDRVVPQEYSKIGTVAGLYLKVVQTGSPDDNSADAIPLYKYDTAADGTEKTPQPYKLQAFVMINREGSNDQMNGPGNLLPLKFNTDSSNPRILDDIRQCFRMLDSTAANTGAGANGQNAYPVQLTESEDNTNSYGFYDCSRNMPVNLFIINLFYLKKLYEGDITGGYTPMFTNYTFDSSYNGVIYVEMPSATASTVASTRIDKLHIPAEGYGVLLQNKDYALAGARGSSGGAGLWEHTEHAPVYKDAGKELFYRDVQRNVPVSVQERFILATNSVLYIQGGFNHIGYQAVLMADNIILVSDAYTFPSSNTGSAPLAVRDVYSTPKPGHPDVAGVFIIAGQRPLFALEDWSDLDVILQGSVINLYQKEIPSVTEKIGFCKLPQKLTFTYAQPLEWGLYNHPVIPVVRSYHIQNKCILTESQYNSRNLGSLNNETQGTRGTERHPQTYIYPNSGIATNISND